MRGRHGEEPRQPGAQGPAGHAGTRRLRPRRPRRRRRHALHPRRRGSPERRPARLTRWSGSAERSPEASVGASAPVRNSRASASGWALAWPSPCCRSCCSAPFRPRPTSGVQDAERRADLQLAAERTRRQRQGAARQHRRPAAGPAARGARAVLRAAADAIWSSGSTAYDGLVRSDRDRRDGLRLRGLTPRAAGLADPGARQPWFQRLRAGEGIGPGARAGRRRPAARPDRRHPAGAAAWVASTAPWSP